MADGLSTDNHSSSEQMHRSSFLSLLEPSFRQTRPSLRCHMTFARNGWQGRSGPEYIVAAIAVCLESKCFELDEKLPGRPQLMLGTLSTLGARGTQSWNIIKLTQKINCASRGSLRKRIGVDSNVFDLEFFKIFTLLRLRNLSLLVNLDLGLL